MGFYSPFLILTTSLLMFSAFKHLRRRLPITNNTGTTHITLSKKMSTYIPSLQGKKYPAKEHNLKVKNHLLSRKEDLLADNTAVFITGADIEGIKYCDQTKQFRQNRYFFYLSGVNIPGSSLLFNFKTEKLTIFLPVVDSDDVMWSGLPLSIEEAYKKFDADEILYSSEIAEKLTELSKFKVFTTDLDNIHDNVIKKLLIASDPDFFYAMDESRIIKDWYEIQLLRRAAEITDNCHLAVMSALPIEQNEGHIHAEFTYHAIRQGSKYQGYDPICCSGPNCSTLHYVKNDDDIEHKHSVLIDAGAEWENYTADVTRCFPINGSFTKEHREIYEAVLDMQTQVMEKIKPGVHWDTLHLLAHRILIRNFLGLGIFKREFAEEDIFKRRASVCFFPHGLGHLLGLDTHDVGGRPNYEDSDPFLKYLRLRRPLAENMVVTNEPGIYFNPFLIKEYLEKHPERLEVVDRDVMNKYLYIGGVRIEDDILVTKDGYDNLTHITSDPDEIEKIVSEGIAKGRSHFHVIA